MTGPTQWTAPSPLRRTRILAVDDERSILDVIRRRLESEGYEVITARDGEEALKVALAWEPDIAILDVIMPKMDGLELCRRMREQPELAGLPVLFLTSRESVEDRIRGFEAGADDYLPKPFDLRELSLRVRALLRRVRPAPAEADVLRVGRLALHLNTFTLDAGDRQALLTPVEFQLMQHLMKHPGVVFTSERLLREVWGYPAGAGSTDLVRAHIRNIRAKIEPDPAEPIYIRTVSRHGYTVTG
ncbi:MAG: response regulator transcription factor [Chloroflexi bacterium]|nr:response regulator transcription factor [Chloroflexota bacterium]